MVLDQLAPGEEPAVFARKAGVVASKISYLDVLDSTNDWEELEAAVSPKSSALSAKARV